MSRVRILAAVVVAGAIVAGSQVDLTRGGPPVMAGGYYVLAADFHVHAFPGDGALPPWELAREARRRGLHAIVISNHNQMVAARIRGWFAEDGVLLIPSQEMTTPRFHMIAAGITSTIDWRLPDLDVVRAIHAQGGVAIAAHPVGTFWQGSDALLPALDGVEVAHPLTMMEPAKRSELTSLFARAQAVNPSVAPIGSSDFHMVAPLGVDRTYVFAETATIDGVLDAVRAGRTVAQDHAGVLYGDRALTRLIEQGGVAAPVPPVPALAWMTALVALFGLLALVVLR
jgi:hypothetical protein